MNLNIFYEVFWFWDVVFMQVAPINQIGPTWTPCIEVVTFFPLTCLQR
jgi:hypothetical protein